MQKALINGFIFGQKNWDDSITYCFWNSDITDVLSGYFMVCEHSFEVDIPDSFDITKAELASLEKQKDKVRAEFARRVAEIDNKINSLLSIEG